MYGDIDVRELEGAWKWKEVGHVPGCIEFIQLGDVYSWRFARRAQQGVCHKYIVIAKPEDFDGLVNE